MQDRTKAGFHLDMAASSWIGLQAILDKTILSLAGLPSANQTWQLKIPRPSMFPENHHIGHFRTSLCYVWWRKGSSLSTMPLKAFVCEYWEPSRFEHRWPPQSSAAAVDGTSHSTMWDAPKRNKACAACDGQSTTQKGWTSTKFHTLW